MLAKAQLTAFLATTDSGRTRAFYLKVLALRLVAEDEFALVFETAGVQLRIQKVEHFTPHPFTALGWQVPDIGRSVRQLNNRGVRPERYPFLEQDEDGIWMAPSGTRVAWFKDPDGQLLSFSQAPSARPARPKTNLRSRRRLPRRD
jgi:catechol 2,3-dioxygenase-like lactoylglutathione lyase family enzyme